MLSLELLEDRRLLSVSPAATATPITSVRDGLWSSPATWSGGVVPTATDDVVITNNVTIDHATAHEVDINAGTTTLAGDLQAYASVIVRGHLAGSQGTIAFHIANDRLFKGDTSAGPNPAVPDFHPEDTGLWALPGSSVSLQGAAVTSWLNAVGSGAAQDLGHGVTQQVAFRAGAATLQSAPVGWQAGDTLLLVNEQGQSVLADLVSISGTSLQYHEHKAQPTSPDLVGHELITAGTSTLVFPKIADLTRRIQIVSADVHEGDATHRAQTAFLNGAAANLVNVEFRDLGPRGEAGSYPIYFDGGGAVTSSLTGSSIWQDVTDPGNRFVALHNVQGVTIANNVAFRAQGDGFFLEDSNDFGNTITGNLSAQVTGDEELPNPDSEVTQLTHHYWLRTGNTISANVAAGGDAIGMIILASAHATPAVVSDTQAFGTGFFGLWTGTPNVTFNNPISVYNSRAGFASDPAWDVDSHGATLNNPLFLLNGTNDSAYGSQIYLNDSGIITVNGGVLAGVKAVHTHYHSAFVIANSEINVNVVNTPTYWEQNGVFDHDTIQAGLLFEQSYPAPRYTSPGIVRFTAVNLHVTGEAPEVETADYMGNTFQNYPSIPGTSIPNAIELDQPAPASGFIRVTMLSDADRWMTNIARWTVTPIGQTPVKMSYIYHRQTAWTQLGSLGGYPDGFPPGEYAVSLYTDDGTFLKSAFAVVRSGQVSDLVDSLPGGNPAAVVGRQLFYNNSKYDGGNSAVNSADDNAIAADKIAYPAGSGAASFANVSSYSKGINGLMIDIAGAHSAITAGDFSFKVGNDNSPTAWASAPPPSAVVVRAGAGVGGSDRVEIIWPNNAIQNTWLQVAVAANANTGLTAADTFYFASAIGDTGAGDTTAAVTDALDENAVREHTPGSRNLPDTNPYDVNRDGAANASDMVVIRNHTTSTFTAPRFLVIGGSASASALSAPGDSGVASALAGAASANAMLVSGAAAPSGVSPPAIQPPQSLTADYFERLGQTGRRALQKERDQPNVSPVAVAPDFDELLDAILADRPGSLD